VDERLWAPWRLSYVQGDKREEIPQKVEFEWLPGAEHDCFICQAVAERTAGADRRRWVVDRREHCIVILNKYPYNNGHLLIAPLGHKSRLDELTPDEHADIMDAAGLMVRTLEETIRAQGFNIGLNLGRVGGAGLPGHLHWHTVPRWDGDTNFMPVTAGIKVIPQSLDALWEALAASLGNLPGPS